MKIILINIIAVILISNLGYAQSAYHGGKGDGYAFAEVIITDAGINKPLLNQSFNVYPNPVKKSQAIYLQTSMVLKNTLQYCLRNTLGEVMFEGELEKLQITTRLPFLCIKEGVYFLSINTKEQRQTFKLIVN